MREHFLRIITWCYNTLRNEGRMTADKAFRELNMLLYIRYAFEECKEMDIYQYIQHTTIPIEDLIKELFSKVKEQYRIQNVFSDSDVINIEEGVLLKLLSSLRDVDFKNGCPELGEAYEDYLTRVVKKLRNRAIVLPEVIDYINNGLRLKNSDNIVNPYCGYGEILTTILTKFKGENRPALFAADTDRLMAQTTLLNVMLHGEPFVNVEYMQTRKRKEKDCYDVVISAVPYKDGRLATDAEELLALLKQGGRAALVVPSPILNHEHYRRMRCYIMEHYTIRNITSLPIGTIKTGTNSSLKMSILFIERKESQQQDLSTQFIQIKSKKDSSLGIQKTNIQELSIFLNRNIEEERLKKTEGVTNVSLIEEKNWDVDAYFAKKNAKTRSKYPEYRLGDILKGVSYSSEKPEDKTVYKLVTVRSKQHDVVLRKKTKGENIKTRSVWRIREGQLLISRIGAKDGAIGIVPKGLGGALVSGNFLVLEINESMALPYYLVLAMTTSIFKATIAGISSGMTKRSWLKFHDLMECRIPLPDLQTQRNLVADLVGLQKRISRLESKWETGQEMFSKMIYGI